MVFWLLSRRVSFSFDSSLEVTHSFIRGKKKGNKVVLTNGAEIAILPRRDNGTTHIAFILQMETRKQEKEEVKVWYWKLIFHFCFINQKKKRVVLMEHMICVRPSERKRFRSFLWYPLFVPSSTSLHNSLASSEAKLFRWLCPNITDQKVQVRQVNEWIWGRKGLLTLLFYRLLARLLRAIILLPGVAQSSDLGPLLN